MATEGYEPRELQKAKRQGFGKVDGCRFGKVPNQHVPGFSEGTVSVVGCLDRSIRGINPIKMLLLRELLAGDVLGVAPPRIQNLKGGLLHKVGGESFTDGLVQILKARRGKHPSGAYLVPGSDVRARNILYLESFDGELFPIRPDLTEAQAGGVRIGFCYVVDRGIYARTRSGSLPGDRDANLGLGLGS